MSRARLTESITLLANIGVLAGLGLVAFELRQNTDQLALELQWQVTDRMLQNNRDLLGDNPALVFEKFTTDPETLTFAEFQIASALLFDFLSVWEDKYFLYEAGLAPESDWKEFVDDDIGYTLGSRFARHWWNETKHVFEPEIVEYVDARLPDVGDDASLRWYSDTMRRLSEDQSGSAAE